MNKLVFMMMIYEKGLMSNKSSRGSVVGQAGDGILAWLYASRAACSGKSEAVFDESKG
jgi:hypothetical protein